jgi:hypothetical protein
MVGGYLPQLMNQKELETRENVIGLEDKERNIPVGLWKGLLLTKFRS